MRLDASRQLVIGTLVLAAAGLASAAVGPLTNTVGARMPTRCMLRFETDGAVKFALAPRSVHPDAFRLHCTCLRDGDRLDVLTIREDNGKLVCGWRSIIDGWFIAYEVPPAGKLAVGGLYARDGNQFVGAVMPSGLMALNGYVTGDFPSLTQIIQSATKLKTAAEDLDGVACQKLEAQSPDYGRFQIWLDPARGNCPIKIVVEKNANCYWGRQRLSQWTNLAPSGSRGTVLLRSMTFTLDQARFDYVQGYWIPLSCRLVRVEQFADGNEQTVTMNCRRTGLDLHPNFHALGAFVPQLRDGARLENQSDAYLPYRWQRGGPQPLVDPSVVKQMDKTAAALHRELASGAEGENR